MTHLLERCRMVARAPGTSPDLDQVGDGFGGRPRKGWVQLLIGGRSRPYLGDDPLYMPLHTDPSNGYEAVANEFAQRRRTSEIGLATIRKWAVPLPAGAAVLDLGCGSGFPVSVELNRLGYQLAGIDASPTLIAEFHRQLPGAPWACEAVEHSAFFGRKFDAIVAIGLIFLLPEEAQRNLIAKISNALDGGGRFLFSAPHQVCSWKDVLTGKTSKSLGAVEYEAALGRTGLSVAERLVDEGENHYFACRKIWPG